MSLAQAKTCGGIGAIVSLVGLFGFGFPIVRAAGIILILIAVKQISDELEEKKIFDKYLVSFILGLIVIAGLMVSLHGFAFLIENGTPKVTHPSRLLALFSFAALGVLSKIYLRTSYEIVARRTNIDKFRKAGFFYLIGSIFFVAVTGYSITLVVNIHDIMDDASALFIALTVLVFLGFFILMVANIYEIMAYFSLPGNREGDKRINIITLD